MGPSGEELAATLAARLRRLEAIRDAAGTAGEPRTGWAGISLVRGAPEVIIEERALGLRCHPLRSAFCLCVRSVSATPSHNVTIARAAAYGRWRSPADACPPDR